MDPLPCLSPQYDIKAGAGNFVTQFRANARNPISILGHSSSYIGNLWNSGDLFSSGFEIASPDKPVGIAKTFRSVPKIILGFNLICYLVLVGVGTGMRTKNRLPLGWLGSTQTAASCAAAIRRTIVRPNPLPLLASLPSWILRSRIRSRSRSEMAVPKSFTETKDSISDSKVLMPGISSGKFPQLPVLGQMPHFRSVSQSPKLMRWNQLLSMRICGLQRPLREESGALLLVSVAYIAREGR